MTSKVDKYPAIIGGVSQQVPHLRRPSQNTEQVNMLSDPVRGVVRREGSLNLDEVLLASGSTVLDHLDAAHEDVKSFRHIDFTVDGVDYTLFYRTAERPAYSTLPAYVAFNRTTGRFIPITTDPGSDLNLVNAEAAGFSATVAAGRYVFMASPALLPTIAIDNLYAASFQRTGVVWLRGGAYSRTFTVTVRLTTGATVTYSYTTPASSYPTLLDTSDILTADPDYTKKVNDRTNAYNSEVTRWIGTSSAAVQPAAIANSLYGGLFPLMLAQGSSIGLAGSYLTFSINIESISVSDGGDGSLIRGVASTVDDVGQLTPRHLPGKLVQIRPKASAGSDAYYMRADKKDSNSTDALPEVVWREAAGVAQVPTRLFAYATPYAGGLAIASTAINLQDITGSSHPGLTRSACGDTDTIPLPNFYQKTINYLGLFQDRLVVGTGSVLNFSRVGDYLNFYRSSVLTIEDDDAMEYFALGSEGDVIRYDQPHDQSLLLFGDLKQYRINGRNVLSAKAPNITPVAEHKGATDAPPLLAGNYVFFGKTRENFTAVNQIKAGIVAESPEIGNVSQAVDTYIQGAPIELVAITDPNVLFLRTKGNPYGVYVYGYIDDDSGQRKHDSWSRWSWDPILGPSAGIVSDNGRLLVLTLRVGVSWLTDDPALFWSMDEFSPRADLSDRPYLDSARRAVRYREPSGSGPERQTWLTDKLEDQGDVFFAFGQDVDFSLIGAPADDLATLAADYPADINGAWVGVAYDAYVTPTNPVIRDRNGDGVNIGRFTIGKLEVALESTGGATVTRTDRNGTKTIGKFEGYVVGEDTLARQPVTSYILKAWPRKERREFDYSIAADGWLPLTISGITYEGQVFA